MPKLTEKIIKNIKLSEATKGHVVTEETRRKLRIAHKGKKLSAEHKRNIGLSGRGREHSSVSKNKISRSLIRTDITEAAILKTFKDIIRKHGNKIGRKLMFTAACKKLKCSHRVIVRLVSPTNPKIRPSIEAIIDKIGIDIPSANHRSRIGKNETKLLDEYQSKSGYTVHRQYHVDGFYLDGYIKELNLPIEVDEHHHYIANRLNIVDIIRENKIKNILKCKDFLRIKDLQCC